MNRKISSDIDTIRPQETAAPSEHQPRHARTQDDTAPLQSAAVVEPPVPNPKHPAPVVPPHRHKSPEREVRGNEHGEEDPAKANGGESGVAHEANKPADNKDDAKKPKKPWLKMVGLIVLAGALLFGIPWGIRYWNYSQVHAATDDAQTTTNLVQITPQVNGNIKNIYVRENEQVKAGQLLVQLDDASFRADVAQAQANLEAARAGSQGAGSSVQLTRATGSAQIVTAQGNLQQTSSGIGQAQADAERARAGIANARAATQAAKANVGNAQAALQAAIAARNRAIKNVGSAQALINTALAQVNAAQSGVTTAQAAVRQAQSNVGVAQANTERASKDQTRYAALFQQNAISAQQLDVATAAATSARSQLDAANQAVEQAQSVVLQRQADLAAAQAGVTQRQADFAAAQDAVHAAEAQVQQARTQIAANQDQVRAAQANIESAQAQYASAQENVKTAQAKRQSAQGQLQQAQTAPGQVAVQQANQQNASAKIAQAQAALQTAQLNLERTRITAPVTGLVSKKTIELGQQVAIGQALMIVVPNNDVWVVANFKETQMRDVRANQPVEIEVDTFPGMTFRGHVDSIAAATGATFSVLPPDNSTGNFTKVVQRVPVKILFDQKQGDKEQQAMPRLGGGLSVNVTIDTSRH